MKPTPEQIATEIARLKELKPKIRQYDMFGEDNRRKLQVQISVLEEKIGQDDLDEMEEGERGAGDEALSWLAGETTEGLADGWEPLVQEVE